MKFITRFLIISLIVILSLSIIGLIAIMGFMFFDVPTGAYVAGSLVIVGLLVNHYIILIGILIYTLLFLTIFSVRKRHIVLPILSCLYFVIDICFVVDNYVITSIGGIPLCELVSMIISITMVVFLCIYCYKCIREKIHNRKQSKEPPESTAQLDEPGT